MGLEEEGKIGRNRRAWLIPFNCFSSSTVMFSGLLGPRRLTAADGVSTAPLLAGFWSNTAQEAQGDSKAGGEMGGAS